MGDEDRMWNDPVVLGVVGLLLAVGILAAYGAYCFFGLA